MSWCLFLHLMQQKHLGTYLKLSSSSVKKESEGNWAWVFLLWLDQDLCSADKCWAHVTSVLTWEEFCGCWCGSMHQAWEEMLAALGESENAKKRQASREKRTCSTNQRNTLWGRHLPPLATMTWGLAACLFFKCMYVCTHSSKHFAISCYLRA